MPGLLLVLLLVVPLVEVYVLIQVGHLLGAVPTIAVLLAVSLLGAALLRREGSRAFRAFRDAASHGRLPAREAADGALVLVGGALLLTPGFVTDAVGVLLVLPPTRALVRGRLLAYAAGRALRTTRRQGPGDRVIDGNLEP